MDTKNTVSRDINDLTRQQLSVVIYHIAQRTQVSLDYTERYKLAALFRASDLLAEVEEVEEEFPPAMDIFGNPEKWASFVESMQESSVEFFTDLDSPDLELNTGIEARHEHKCHNDPEVICICDINERIECDWIHRRNNSSVLENYRR